MTPFEVYKSYLSLKNHFTKEKYDYHQFCGKSKCSLKSFYGRRDRFWFEKLSRNKDDKEIVEFFVSNFTMSDDPSSLWIGTIIRDGEKNYTEWKKKVQSLSYFFKEETQHIFSNHHLDEVFVCSKSHPILLKMFLRGNVSLETLVIFDKIFSFTKDFDKKLKDPIWETVSLKIKKYSAFLHIDVFCYKKILKEVVLEEK